MSQRPGEITVMLRSSDHRLGKAMVDDVVTVLYRELKQLAQGLLKKERPDHTLRPTALVHEVYFKLLKQEKVGWNDRTHFFGAAARIIRRILVDHARGKKRLRRGGGAQVQSVDDLDIAIGKAGIDLIDLEAALTRLQQIREIQARIVELRFFGGMSIDEIAKALNVSKRTVDREWLAAKVWLRQALGSEEA